MVLLMKTQAEQKHGREKADAFYILCWSLTFRTFPARKCVGCVYAGHESISARGLYVSSDVAYEAGESDPEANPGYRQSVYSIA